MTDKKIKISKIQMNKIINEFKLVNITYDKINEDNIKIEVDLKERKMPKEYTPKNKFEEIVLSKFDQIDSRLDKIEID